VKTDRALGVMAMAFSSAVTGAALVFIGMMLLAAVAFSSATTTFIPFVVTFHGYRDPSGSPVIDIDGSLAAMGVASILVAVIWWMALAALLAARAKRRGALALPS